MIYAAYTYGVSAMTKSVTYMISHNSNFYDTSRMPVLLFINPFYR